jgi:hypothetical protein
VLVHRYVDAGYAGHLTLTPGREKRRKISQKLPFLKVGGLWLKMARSHFFRPPAAPKRKNGSEPFFQPCRCLWRLSLQMT